MDPGKDKTGCAVVGEDGSLVEKKVIPTARYEKEIFDLLAEYPGPGIGSWKTAATGFSRLWVNHLL